MYFLAIKPTSYLSSDVIGEDHHDISEDELEYPIYNPETKILTVQTFNRANEMKILKIQLVHDPTPKPWLGGFKIMPHDIEYHHAQTQTILLTRTWSQKFQGTIYLKCKSNFSANLFFRFEIKSCSNKPINLKICSNLKGDFHSNASSRLLHFLQG